jgi:hypothetical protein
MKISQLSFFSLSFSAVLAALALLAISIGPALAEEEKLTFIASVDKTRLGLEDHLVLTVSVSGSDIGGIPEPMLPDLKDFQLVGTNRSSSSQFTLVNGKMTSSKIIDYMYTLRPEKIGKLTIGSATLDFKGGSYRTEPIQVEVVQGSVSGKSSPKTQVPTPPAPAITEDMTSDDLFVRVEFDRRTIYIGQQVTATYALYNRTNLTNVQYGQIPSFTGFWTEEIFDAERLNFQQQVIGGRRYQVAVLKKLALFPTTSGEVEVEPLQLICDLRQPGRDLFDFFGRTRRVRISTKSATINVKPLPTEGQPADFSGAVGQYTLKASVDRTQVAAGEPLELTVEIHGEGNLKTLSPPRLPTLEHFKSFDPEITETTARAGGRIGGSKRYSYVLIPKEEGTYRIDPLVMTFFDPDRAQYRQTRTDPIDLRILPGQEETAPLTMGLSKEEIRVLGTDIRYIKPAPEELKDQGHLLYRSLLFQIIQAIPLLAVVGAIVARRRRDRLTDDLPYARRRRALKAARKHLRGAEKYIDTPSSAPFCGEISRILCAYLADKLNLTATGLTTREIRRELTRRRIDKVLIRQATDCLSACDLARFAPLGDRMKDRRKLLDEARDLISKLERAGL